MAVFIILFVLSFVVAGVHIYRDEQPRTGGRVAEILLIWLLVINIGFGGSTLSQGTCSPPTRSRLPSAGPLATRSRPRWL